MNKNQLFRRGSMSFDVTIWVLVAAILTAGIAFLASDIIRSSLSRSKEMSASVLSYMPPPTKIIEVSDSFDAPLLRGIKLFADDPFKFAFILDEGDRHFSEEELKTEASRLVKYFLAGLTMPEDDLWVNLSPHEKNRIIPQKLALTDMGKDMLGQDYCLKQLSSSLIYPESELGKEYWQQLYAKINQQYGTTNLNMDTRNKVWIVPDESLIYEDQDRAFIAKSHLKVMTENDYIALSHQTTGNKSQSKVVNELSSEVMKDIIIPEIEKDINYGTNFTRLRQIYNSLLLAVWFKDKLRNHVVTQLVANQRKINGVQIDDPALKDKIYKQYLEAYRKGVFNYLKKDHDIASGKKINRHYYSGGVTLKNPLGKAEREPLSPNASKAKNTMNGAAKMLVVGLSSASAVAALPAYASQGSVTPVTVVQKADKNQAPLKKARKVLAPFLGTTSSMTSLLVKGDDWAQIRIAPVTNVVESQISELESLLGKMPSEQIPQLPLGRAINRVYYYRKIQGRLLKMLLNAAKKHDDYYASRYLIDAAIEALNGEMSQGGTGAMLYDMFKDYFSEAKSDLKKRFPEHYKEAKDSLNQTLTMLADLSQADRDSYQARTQISNKDAENRLKEAIPNYDDLLSGASFTIADGNSRVLSTRLNPTTGGVTTVSVSQHYSEGQRFLIEVGSAIYDNHIHGTSHQQAWQKVAQGEMVDGGKNEELRYLFGEDFMMVVLTGHVTDIHWWARGDDKIAGGFSAQETAAQRTKFFKNNFTGMLHSNRTKPSAIQRLRKRIKVLPTEDKLKNTLKRLEWNLHTMPLMKLQPPKEIITETHRPGAVIFTAMFYTLTAVSAGTIDDVKKTIREKVKDKRVRRRLLRKINSFKTPYAEFTWSNNDGKMGNFKLKSLTEKPNFDGSNDGITTDIKIVSPSEPNKEYKPLMINGQLMGLYYYDAQGIKHIALDRIAISQNLSYFQKHMQLNRPVTLEEAMRFTDLHETMHALIDWTGVVLESNLEEQIANITATAAVLGTIPGGMLTKPVASGILSVQKALNARLKTDGKSPILNLIEYLQDKDHFDGKDIESFEKSLAQLGIADVRVEFADSQKQAEAKQEAIDDGRKVEGDVGGIDLNRIKAAVIGNGINVFAHQKLTDEAIKGFPGFKFDIIDQNDIIDLQSELLN
ncbi:MAG: hypothetical protein GY858_07685 [Candidatus Omnitrophica bacterium]|nr:hypothetical protein [Candidatus Omnitrophota bacterium]